MIELLIVVAIIGLLAAIAVPNFLEAQVRAKVARAQSEFRSIDTALTLYHMDWNWYPGDYVPYLYCGWPCPPGQEWNFDVHLRPLTTPVAYITNLPVMDPFADAKLSPFGKYFYENHGDHDYWYDGCGSGTHKHHEPVCPADGHTIAILYQRCFLWMLKSFGPDRSYQWGPVLPYDATNGTVSSGDIIRVGP